MCGRSGCFLGLRRVARDVARRHFVALALVALAPGSAFAHDVPNDVTVLAFVKPEEQRLRLLVRVPLEAMRDIEFPQRGPGYLDLTRAEPWLRDAASMWIAENVELYEDETRLRSSRLVAVLASLPSDPSFVSFDRALAHVTGPPLPADTDLYWNQGMLDVLLEYPIRSDASRFSLHPAFGRLGLRVATALRFLPPGGDVRAFELHDDPGLVRLDPRWHQALMRFVGSGLFHILEGVDHLLFLFCLVIPFRRFRALVLVVTSFTVAHSVTLIASAYKLGPDALWFPPLVETLIAMSIVYMALENIVGATLTRRWLITFGFGLVHGFGFSFALRDTLQFAGSHLLTSLLAFNIGVEIGQIAVLALLIPALELLFRFGVAERMGTIILSVLAAHTSWHWMTERLGQLSQFPWPVFDAGFVADTMRWLMVVLLVVALVWVVVGILAKRNAGRASAGAEERTGVS